MSELLDNDWEPLSNAAWEAEKQEYIKKIDELSQKLNELSWLQSNILRNPLTRMMGIIPLIQENVNGSEDDREIMLKYLLTTVKELDWALKYIQNKSKATDSKD